MPYTISPPGGSVTVGGAGAVTPPVAPLPSDAGITGIFASTFVKNAIFSLKRENTHQRARMA